MNYLPLNYLPIDSFPDNYLLTVTGSGIAGSLSSIFSDSTGSFQGQIGCGGGMSGSISATTYGQTGQEGENGVLNFMAGLSVLSQLVKSGDQGSITVLLQNSILGAFGAVSGMVTGEFHIFAGDSSCFIIEGDVGEYGDRFNSTDEFGYNDGEINWWQNKGRIFLGSFQSVNLGQSVLTVESGGGVGYSGSFDINLDSVVKELVGQLGNNSGILAIQSASNFLAIQVYVANLIYHLELDTKTGNIVLETKTCSVNINTMPQ